MTGGQEVVGKRCGASLIDLLILTAVFFAVSAASGGLHTSGSTFQANVHGGWAILYGAIVLGYYFVGEGYMGGRTVGKALLGLKVVQPDGMPPTPTKAAVRTILRLVDALPLLYLVGFACVLVTGPKAQRIGDMAAGTTVVAA
jgi:uncharacterized RDD family membrane protein YckC